MFHARMNTLNERALDTLRSLISGLRHMDSGTAH